jgi:hypothetical protein
VGTFSSTRTPDKIQPACVFNGVTATTVLQTYDGGAGVAGLGAILSQNPFNPLEIITTGFLGGNSQLYVADYKLYYWRTYTGIITALPARTLLVDGDGAGNVPFSHTSGFDSNGRFHVLYAMEDSAYTIKGIYHKYSDDDLATFSTPISIGVPADVGVNIVLASLIGSLIGNNGVLIASCYGTNASGSVSIRYVLRCSNYRSSSPTWSYVKLDSATTPYINESCLAVLDDTHLISLHRTEYAPFELMQYRSTDNGATTGNWTQDGLVNFYTPDLTVNAGPVVLKSFMMEGKKVVACYHLDKPNAKIFVIYALASDLITNGLTAWKIASKTTLITGTAGISYHYGDAIHLNNNFNSLLCFYHEVTTPWTYTHNTIEWLNPLNSHYATVKSALGI